MTIAAAVSNRSRALAGLLLGAALTLAVGCSPAPADDGAGAAAESAEQATPKGSFQRGQEFLANNGERPGVVTTESGLQYEVLASGTGARPGPTDLVTTHYHGTFIDGSVFDSSVERDQPMEFPVDGVIAGWTEALQLMRVGDKWKLYVPSELAYGGRGNIGIGPHEVLIFEVELIDVRAS